MGSRRDWGPPRHRLSYYNSRGNCVCEACGGGASRGTAGPGGGGGRMRKGCGAACAGDGPPPLPIAFISLLSAGRTPNRASMFSCTGCPGAAATGGCGCESDVNAELTRPSSSSRLRLWFAPCARPANRSSRLLAGAGGNGVGPPSSEALPGTGAPPVLLLGGSGGGATATGAAACKSGHPPGAGAGVVTAGCC